MATAAAMTACSSSSTSAGSAGPNAIAGYGSVPAQSSTVTNGGTVRFALSPGASPNFIDPVMDSTHNSVYNVDYLVNQLWRPLYWTNKGSAPQVDYSLSLASAPVYSNDNKTVTIKLDQGYKWSDGTPVTANDLLFDIDLIKAGIKENPGAWAQYVPGFLPDNITSTQVVSSDTLQINFSKTVNSGYILYNEIGLLYPLPSAQWNIASTGGPHLDFTNPANAKSIYDYIYKQSSTLSTYGASNSLWNTIDGPWKIKSYDVSTGAVDFLPNPGYTGPNKPKIAEFDELPYKSTDAEFNDLIAGKVDVGFVDQADVPQVSNLKKKGYAVYGLGDWGFQYMLYNYKSTDGEFAKIISQLYVRQALAHLLDENADIKGAMDGAGGVSYSPIPSVPTSPYATSAATTNPYPFSLTAASSLFSSHGWKVVNGALTCETAGTAANECGAGITQGTVFSYKLDYANSPAWFATIVDAYVSNAKKIGITITTKTEDFNTLTANDNDTNPQASLAWDASDFGGFTLDDYPTTNGIFNSGGASNMEGYSNSTVDSLIHNSIYSTDPTAVEKEAQYIEDNVPALFEANPDYIYAWKTSLSGPSDSFTTLTQFQVNPELWYYTKQ